MELTKHHGLANDFLVVLDETNADPPVVDADLARRLCDRRRGVGADGFIHGRRPGPDDRGVDVVMDLYNADGSRAEISGNGLRCLAQAVAIARDDHALHLVVRTGSGDRVATVSGGPRFQVLEVSVDMGPARPGPDLPPAVVERVRGRAATVDLGNPHLVVLVDDATAVDPTVDGPPLEAQFPAGINVEFVSPGDPVDSIDMVVWERGVGATEACGSGACAAAHAAHSWGLVGERVEVLMPGGVAEVAVGDHLTLIGPVSHIATVEWAGG